MFGIMRRQPRIEWDDAGRREAASWRRQQDVEAQAEKACASANSDADFARIEAAYESQMEKIEKETDEPESESNNGQRKEI